MVDIHQVRVEVQVLIAAGLNRGVGGLVGRGAWREGELGEEGVGRERHAGDGSRGEVSGRGAEDLLDLRMGGLGPVGSEGCHLGWCLVGCSASCC
jgi:hypothetical protein